MKEEEETYLWTRVVVYVCNMDLSLLPVKRSRAPLRGALPS